MPNGIFLVPGRAPRRVLPFHGVAVADNVAVESHAFPKDVMQEMAARLDNVTGIIVVRTHDAFRLCFADDARKGPQVDGFRF